MAKAKGEHYVDNKKFLNAMIEWKTLCAEKEEAGDEPPPVTNYIGECFYKIATHLSYRPNFINYTYRDEMISDGIQNCLQYVSNFNPEKSKNPFAYFTQIIYYAFLRRIAKEKKQAHVKHKLIEKTGTEFYTQNPNDDRVYSMQGLNITDFLPDEDVYKPKKKESKKKEGLTEFMDKDAPS